MTDALETAQVLAELMGKDVEARFKFIMERSSLAQLGHPSAVGRWRPPPGRGRDLTVDL